MKKFLSFAVGFLVLTLLVAGGVKLRQKRLMQIAEQPPPASVPWAVRTAGVLRGTATQGFPALAVVEGTNEVAVSPRLQGIILEMGPREGEHVTGGQVLARLDTRELEEKLAALEADLAGARADAERKQRDYERALKLLKAHNISESEVDARRSAAEAAAEKVKSLQRKIAAERVRLDYARITAPFDGVISARLADPGELATVGKPLYRLISTRGGRLQVRLPLEVLEQLHPGAPVIVSKNGHAHRFRATRIFPSVDERELGRLEIDVDEVPFGAPAGALLRARVVTAAVDDALLVPPEAVIAHADAPRGHVLRLTTDTPPRAQWVPVRIVLRAAGAVAVEGELSPGDRVVVGHEATLLRIRDGDPLRPGGPGA